MTTAQLARPPGGPWTRRVDGTCGALATAAAWMILIPGLPGEGALMRWAALVGAGLSLALLLRALFSREGVREELLFAGSLLLFLAGNAVAAYARAPLPGIGGPEASGFHVTGVSLALCAGLGLRDRRALRIAVLGVLLISAGYYLRELVSLLYRDRFLDGRFVGHRLYHTLTGNELVLLLSLHLGWALATRVAWERGLASAAAAVLGVLLALNNTRSALLALVAVVVPAALLMARPLGPPRRRRRAVALWLGAGIPVAAAFWWIASDPGRHSLANLLSRVEAWKIALQITAAAPPPALLLGHGAWERVFPAAAIHYGTDAPVTAGGETFVHAHNALLQVLVEAGLLGAGLLLLAFGLGLTRAARAVSSADDRMRPPACALFLAVLAFAAVLQLDAFLHRLVGFLGWLLLGMAFALGRCTENAPRRA